MRAGVHEFTSSTGIMHQSQELGVRVSVHLNERAEVDVEEDKRDRRARPRSGTLFGCVDASDREYRARLGSQERKVSSSPRLV